MNENFTAFVELGRKLASDRGISWDIPLDLAGAALDSIGWNLTQIVSDVPPPAHYMRDLGTDAKALAILNARRAAQGLSEKVKRPLSVAWQDLIKASVLEQLLFKRNTTGYVVQSITRPMRVLATCTEKEPWELTADDFKLAAGIGSEIQATGKLGDLVLALSKVIFDAQHICGVGPIYNVLRSVRTKQPHRKARHVLAPDELRASLEQRKRSERLPTRRAFWELTRIVMTEKPQTFMDELRFVAVRVMLVTGFRAGEAALLPMDWKRERTYLDSRGRPAGEVGGISSSLMVRHFAEKQQEEASDSRVLRENAQPVPEMFRQILTESLDRVELLTRPLRETLKLQCQTGRLLPWYGKNDIVPFRELYTRLTGNPFWLDIDRAPFLEKYRKEFAPEVLEELNRFQADLYGPGSGKLDMAIYMLGNRLQRQMKEGKTPLHFRTSAGAPIGLGERMSWNDASFCVGELEDHIRLSTPTKISDVASLRLEAGHVQSWEFLFLQPKRSLAEERNEGICDVTRYMSIGRPDPSFIGIALGDAPNIPSIFEKYGATPEDRSLKIESHMLRHLQNTELFRLGVADTIISKRFNRRSIAQSYEYDHRSLAEELDQIEIGEDVELMLGEKAATVARMIKLGKANGPIVEAFRRIQATEGDAVAYEYLRVEADGFHATPYGHCLNSFTVDPCPKHLECFANCRHLSATDLPENRENLVRLEGKFKAAIETIRSRPARTTGWKNQLEHAEQRLAGVQALLSTPPGQKPFPNGIDLSQPKSRGIFDD